MMRIECDGLFTINDRATDIPCQGEQKSQLHYTINFDAERSSCPSNNVKYTMLTIRESVVTLYDLAVSQMAKYVITANQAWHSRCLHAPKVITSYSN